jgi:hypothetical protein
MTDKYNPSEDLKQYLHECSIQSYRLVDGTYLIAEEVDRDEHNNILYVAGALEFIIERSGKSYLQPWLDTEDDDLVQICGDKIVGTTDTPFHLKMHYHRYFIVEKLQNVLTPREMSSILKQMFNPPVDNQDLMEDIEEGEEWKVDKSTMDYHMEWRKKHKGNN